MGNKNSGRRRNPDKLPKQVFTIRLDPNVADVCRVRRSEAEKALTEFAQKYPELMLSKN